MKCLLLTLGDDFDLKWLLYSAMTFVDIAEYLKQSPTMQDLTNAMHQPLPDSELVVHLRQKLKAWSYE